MLAASDTNDAVRPPEYSMVVEKDVGVPLRDGLELKADIYRPDADDQFPVLVNLGPYNKDRPVYVETPVPDKNGYDWTHYEDFIPGPDTVSSNLNHETVLPEWWVPRGYATLRVDMRGTGKSPGYCDIWSTPEAEDFYDIIEWASRQPWCDGNVGTIGISYYTTTQWNLAGLQPPSLRAMVAWEGFSDYYRDLVYHGGIPCLNWLENWWQMVTRRNMWPETENLEDQFENMFERTKQIKLDGVYYEGKRGKFDKISVPVLSAANWGDTGKHLRGNIEGYVRAASVNKKLRIHTGSHIGPFYTDDARLEQIRFLDHWLKGIDNGVMNEPPVKIQIRTDYHSNEWRFENEWPLARTRWIKGYLDPANDGSLSPRAPNKAAAVTYSATDPGDGSFRGCQFSMPPFTENTEITGPINLVMWVSSSVEDMDIFATVRNIDPEGKEVFFHGGRGEEISCTRGWLRVSHRALDLEISTFYRPYHPHDREEKLTPGEIVEVQVEILPIGNLFKKGHRLKLDIQPADGLGAGRFLHDNVDRQVGENTVHTGGEMASYILLPIVPRKC